jgi:hypothetical protein
VGEVEVAGGGGTLVVVCRFVRAEGDRVTALVRVGERSRTASVRRAPACDRVRIGRRADCRDMWTWDRHLSLSRGNDCRPKAFCPPRPRSTAQNSRYSTLPGLCCPA